MSEPQDLFAHLEDSVSQLFGVVGQAGDNLKRNLARTFTTMTLEKWIRLVIIVGAYMLLRPYMIKLAAKNQEKQLIKEDEEAEAEAKKKAEISPNSLRGQVDIPEDSDEEGEEAGATGVEWGKKARKRQREVLKKLIDAEEQRLLDLQEDEDDKDIEQYLT